MVCSTYLREEVCYQRITNPSAHKALVQKVRDAKIDYNKLLNIKSKNSRTCPVGLAEDKRLKTIAKGAEMKLRKFSVP